MSFRNAISRRAHKERSQPQDRAKFGLLEKHKDYVVWARAYHKKEEAIRKLREKAAFKNPDEFYFKMINTRNVDGVHKPENQHNNKYTEEELLIMKTQDIGYVLQKIQSEKKKIERLTSTLHLVSRKYQITMFILLKTDEVIIIREEANAIQLEALEKAKVPPTMKTMPKEIRRETAAAYKELEARKSRVRELEKVYMDMVMQKELQKKGRKCKLREDELIVPTSRPVYKWRAERKR